MIVSLFHRKNYDMLLAKFNQIASQSNSVHPTCRTYKPDPPNLLSTDYPLVCFWQRSAYEKFVKRGNGDTDGLATTKPRRGRPSNDEGGEKHPYLETKDVTPRLSTGWSGPALSQFCRPWPWPSRSGPPSAGPGPARGRPGPTLALPGAGQGRPWPSSYIFS